MSRMNTGHSLSAAAYGGAGGGVKRKKPALASAPRHSDNNCVSSVSSDKQRALPSAGAAGALAKRARGAVAATFTPLGSACRTDDALDDVTLAASVEHMGISRQPMSCDPGQTLETNTSNPNQSEVAVAGNKTLLVRVRDPTGSVHSFPVQAAQPTQVSLWQIRRDLQSHGAVTAGLQLLPRSDVSSEAEVGSAAAGEVPLSIFSLRDQLDA